VPASPANHGYKPGFAAALMLKDLTLSQETAARAGANTPLGAHAAEIYGRFVESGFGQQDFSAIINAIRAVRV
jgi:3-hydroxyisobutyrate dehydrogenase